MCLRVFFASEKGCKTPPEFASCKIGRRLLPETEGRETYQTPGVCQNEKTGNVCAAGAGWRNLHSAIANQRVAANAEWMNAADLRKDYRSGELRRGDLAPDPFRQFDPWFKDAMACPQIIEPNAMTLATSGSDGRVTARTVLLKAWDEKGFVFFTNYTSQKARQIGENPQAALLFAWLPLERQVSISGPAEKISLTESLAYFASRPNESKIGAWVSRQSGIISSRKILEMKFEEMRRKFSQGEIPLPDFWGGYRVVPQTVEFWQGRSSRLHDRFLYTRETDGDGDGVWKIERLSP